MKSNIGEFLAILRKSKGMTQQEVADSVLYGARSAVFARAANLIYVEQAMVMLYFR